MNICSFYYLLISQVWRLSRWVFLPSNYLKTDRQAAKAPALSANSD
jgi:hypothetical protein